MTAPAILRRLYTDTPFLIEGALAALLRLDPQADELRRLRPLLNLSKLAKEAGLNHHTLASKLRRGTKLTPAEAKSVGRALDRTFRRPVGPPPKPILSASSPSVSKTVPAAIASSVFMPPTP